jgi:hypothetical protein
VSELSLLKLIWMKCQCQVALTFSRISVIVSRISEEKKDGFSAYYKLGDELTLGRSIAQDCAGENMIEAENCAMARKFCS